MSLLGSAFILFNGVVFIIVGGLVDVGISGLATALGVMGLVLGLLTLLAAALIYARPEQHVAWGAIVLVLSIMSLFIGGGLIIGMILGIAGGALAIAWKPPVVAPGYTGPYQQPYQQAYREPSPQIPRYVRSAENQAYELRFGEREQSMYGAKYCPKCGEGNSATARFCQSCGSRL